MVIIAIVAILLPAVAGAQVSWPMFQANAAHTGYIPVSFDPNDFTLDWEVTLSPAGQDVNPIAAGDGMVFATLLIYFENHQDDLFALDANDGSILWAKDFADVNSVNPPSYGHGRVYVHVGNHANDTYLYGFTAVDGVQTSKAPLTAQWERYLSPTILDGTVYINGGYGRGLYAYNFFEEPPLRWFYYVTGFDEWTPAVDGLYAYAYAGGTSSNSARLLVVSCTDGSEVFSIDDPNWSWWGYSMHLAPVLGGMNDALVIHNERLISFDLGLREIRYEIEDDFSYNSFYYAHSGQPSVASGVVFVINHGILEARDQMTGVLLWSWSPPGSYEVEGNIIVTDAHVLLLAADRETGETAERGSAIHAIDLDTHLSVWFHHFPEQAPSGHLAWSEGRLYFARRDGVLTALKLLSGYEQSSVIQFESTAYTVLEDVGIATVNLRRAGSGQGSVGVTVSSENGTAIAGSDFTAVNQIVTWNDGDTSDKAVSAIIQNDTAVEGMENFVLTLHSVTGPTTIGAFSRAQVTIQDDEIDVLRLASGGIEISETREDVTVNVVRDGPSTGEVSVAYATVDGTAVGGIDFGAMSGTLSWDDGETTPRAISVSILDDKIVEDVESFSVALSDPTGNAFIGSPSVFAVTIIDDDGPRLQFSSASYLAAETGGTIDVTVKRLGGAEGAVSVDWTTEDGSATAGEDYVADSGTLQWADLDDTDRVITITIVNDGDTEGGENFRVTLSNVIGGTTTLGQPYQTTVSIVDDEAAEHLIPTETEFGQTRPRVAMNAAGNAVVVWDSWKEDGWGWGVYGQRFDTDGDPVGGPFRVSQSTDENQMDGAVAIAANGGFVVVWEADITGGPRIHARRFDASGTPLGDEFVVNTSTSGNQADPRVAVDGAGNSMVVWTGRDDSSFGAFGRVFASDGTPAGAEVALNTHTYLSQHSPSVAGLPAGGFVTVWESYGQEDYDSDGVYARRFDATGTPVGGAFGVNTTTEDNQSSPSVAAVGSGAFLVVWEDMGSLDGAFGSVRGRWFDAASNPVGGEFQINNYSAGDQGRPSAAADTLGRVVVLWEGRSNQDGSEIGVFGRVLFDDGTFASGEIQYNTYTSDSQDQADVACSAAGNLMAVWSSEQQDGSGEGVYGVMWPLPPSQTIFTDGFESGDPSLWSSSVP